MTTRLGLDAQLLGVGVYPVNRRDYLLQRHRENGASGDNE